MQKNLVIVESPAKAKTIEKFLGKDYKVMSSYGHIRDLRKKDLGIDIANNYTPIYEVPADKKNVVAELKKEAKKADIVWLASDEDREGEAISWHLYQALDLKSDKTKRIAFHEITKDAIVYAVEHPRNIDINLVDAQQARRVLDRLVGFELSPILWKKVKPALSAGRVQSVAVKLLVEREREIQNFKTEAAYRVVAIFTKTDNGKKVEIKAELNKRLKTKKEALEFLEKLKSGTFKVDNVEVKPVKKSPAAPFTTSTLQQEASRKLGFPVSMTMSVAQKLYESGQITYMRTDSVNLSDLAINTAREEIQKAYGDNYSKTRKFSTKSKGAQEAHEAIRPTYMKNHTATGTAQEKKLYELIWKRTIASQMADALLERTIITVNVPNEKDLKFTAEGEVLIFDGFLHVYLEGTDDEQAEENSNLLPAVTLQEPLELGKTTATERFTQRPSRYTEASLVRKLEELGIGRPSTYAPTISTIQNREYVEKRDLEGTERKYNVLTLSDNKISDVENLEITGADKNKLVPTDTGIVVTDFLTDSFPRILDYNFTADVEKEFDQIAEGKEGWTDVINNFYILFHPKVEEVVNTQTEHKIGERILGTDPKTGRQVSVKIGRYGPMVQIGTQDDEEKPQFASLQKNQSITTITFEEAMKLFDLPRSIGQFEEKEVTASVGRFGPYVKHGSLFVSLPKGYDPYTITIEEAIPLIENKREKDKQKLIKTFEEDTDLQVLNGRFGAYIAYKKKNFKIPKGKVATNLNYEDCMQIVNSEDKPKSKAKSKKDTEVEPKVKATKAKTTKTAKTKAAKTTKS